MLPFAALADNSEYILASHQVPQANSRMSDFGDSVCKSVPFQNMIYATGSRNRLLPISRPSEWNLVTYPWRVSQLPAAFAITNPATVRKLQPLALCSTVLLCSTKEQDSQGSLPLRRVQRGGSDSTANFSADVVVRLGFSSQWNLRS